MPRLLTVSQAAEQLGISKAKLWQLLAANRIGSVKLDGSRRLLQEHIDAFVDSLDSGQRQASA